MGYPTVKSRIKGSVFGVAVVDALGGPVEFHPRGSFDPVSDFQHNANFDVPAGTWTDDTSMTLCLAKALIDSKGTFVAQAAIRNYIKWHNDGYLSATDDCFDVGNGTTKALMIWQGYFDRLPYIQKDDSTGHEGGQPAIDKVLKREHYCGNGSLMRVSPIGLVYFHDMDEALYNAAASSNATHPYPTCAESCEIYTKLIVRALNGASKEDLAREVAATTFKDKKLRERLNGYSGLQDWEARAENSIDSSGYVVSTLDAALWSFFSTSTFEGGALRAVNLGWDADTVGAVYGGLAGAFYGLEAIPSKWVGGLQKKEVVEEIASGLVSLSDEGL
ncbi:ADP-ribosylation/Crystallin J1 [Aspergillus varians]